LEVIVSIRTNLEFIMAKYDVNQAALALIAGVEAATVSHWMNGKTEPRTYNLQKIADHFNITVDDLRSTEHGIAAKSKPSYKSSPFITPVPSYTYAKVVGNISAGDATQAIAQSDEEYWVNPDILVEYPMGFYLRVTGDSMNNIIQDGMYAFIAPVADARTELAPNEIVAVNVNGDDVTLKRIKFTEEGVFLKPDSTNEKHKVRFIAADDPDAPRLFVIGRFITLAVPKWYKW
jgi:repressor LexA